jgi:uncharacterized protein YjiS (DUF1127 family)
MWSIAMSSLAQRLVAARLRRDDRRDAAVTETVAARVGRTLAEWRRRARSRAQLARFSPRELRDIGLTPADAARECAKPFWLD